MKKNQICFYFCLAAICSGMVPFGIGTDGGGSIRMPSSMTGIFGLKTTFGRIPTNGNVPGEAPKGTVSVAGPMACSMADLGKSLYDLNYI